MGREKVQDIDSILVYWQTLLSSHLGLLGYLYLVDSKESRNMAQSIPVVCGGRF